MEPASRPEWGAPSAGAHYQPGCTISHAAERLSEVSTENGIDLQGNMVTSTGVFRWQGEGRSLSGVGSGESGTNDRVDSECR